MADRVIFDYAAWLARYPQFTPGTSPTGESTGVSEALANLYFAEACVFHDNMPCSIVIDDTIQLALLNMLVAHIATRYAPGQATSGSSIVGPIIHAAEGSVNVGVRAFEVAGSQQWLLTTQPGSDYWYATAPYRTFRYRVGPRRVFNPPLFGPRNRWWPGGI